jgi:hypothetical protein
VAYGTSKANLAQTAVNSAANLTAALVAAGKATTLHQVGNVFTDLRADIYTFLDRIDNENPQEKQQSSGNRGSGGGGKKLTGITDVAEARDVKLKFGKFKDCTLGEVFDMSAEKAESEYGYQTGSGRKYLQWCAKENAEKNPGIAHCAQLLIDDAQSGSPAVSAPDAPVAEVNLETAPVGADDDEDGFDWGEEK